MTTKITVSLPDEQVAALKAAVQAGEANSVSGLVSDILARQQEQRTYDQFLAELTSRAKTSPDDEAWAERELSGL